MRHGEIEVARTDSSLVACFPHVDVKMAPAGLGTVCMGLAHKLYRNRYKRPVAHAAFGDDAACEIADVAHCAL